MSVLTGRIIHEIDRLPNKYVYGRVKSIVGMMVEVEGVEGELSIGDRCVLSGNTGRKVTCEVVGFRNERALLMPFGTLDGIGLGTRAEVSVSDPLIYPDMTWMGRVVNAFGEPVDGKGPLIKGKDAYRVHSKPPHAHERQRVGGKIDLGIRALNTFLTCCRGQRMGIFSGSGVGKSTVMSMMARHTDAEVSVIGLIGERGREAREFIEDDLGEKGMSRSVVIVATSDEPPLIRRQAAYLQMAIAEYFRDQNKDVLCLMDSVTRFAMAQREIGLATGEPPTTKGYTPSVFAMLPRLMERAGTSDKGSITAIYTVLVEGGDMDEPIADAARGILDGHIALSRDLASKNHYPCIDVGHSVSRLFPVVSSDDHKKAAGRMREILARYTEAEDLINIGAYVKGSNPKIDDAISNIDAVNDFLKQGTHDTCQFDDNVKKLLSLM